MGIHDIGFTSAAPLDRQKNLIRERWEHWQWTEEVDVFLKEGYDPEFSLHNAKTIIVLVEHFYEKSFPEHMVKHFGRVYIDDDRITKDGLVGKFERFQAFLREHGIASEAPFYLSHREAAVRAGLGTIGYNCFFYSNKIGLESSWVIPWTIVVDQEFEPDDPVDSTMVGAGCPETCEKACVAACPTGAANGDGTVIPTKCVSYLTYEASEEITPLEYRDAMGRYVYGCDKCQIVCPRNIPWNKKVKDQPLNERAVKKADAFELTKLLHMDKDYFTSKIWLHMFYTSPDSLWKWKMHVARAMGNSKETRYVPHLIEAFYENDDERVLGMIIWSLGKIGSRDAMDGIHELKNKITDSQSLLKKELDLVLTKSPVEVS